MIEALGVTPDEEAVYRTLLDSEPLGLLALQRTHCAFGTAKLRRLLGTLEHKGLVSRIDGPRVRYQAVAPDTALEPLLVAREEALRRARASMAELSEHHRRAPREAMDAVETVPGPAARQRGSQLQLSARREVRSLQTPPYSRPRERYTYGAEMSQLERGVRYRTVYDREAVEAQGPRMLRLGIEAGEEARVVGELPLRMTLIDDQLAFLPMRRRRMITEGLFIVHPSALLDALSALFELIWNGALPLALGADPPPSPQPTRGRRRGAVDDTLLALLAAGLSDRAIAHNLGVSQRTVERRVRDLLASLNARTRFQAGVQVGRRGDEGTTPR